MSGEPIAPPVDAQSALHRSVEANDPDATDAELRATIARHEVRTAALVDQARGTRARIKQAVLMKLEAKKRECIARFDGSAGDAAISVLEEMKAWIAALPEEEAP